MPGGSAPIAAEEFAALMAALGPFESAPAVAVGVSGGADSLALCLLLDRWAGERGGLATALTVDHGLRPESGDETRQVASWLQERGIAHRVLRWGPPRPGSGIQAAARQARYRLMTEWCVGAGVLHLALAHHREDQAETLILRLGRGSGLYGLAGMAPVVARADLRLVRPLLTIPRARLEATVRAFGQSWIEDPSNRNLAYRRVRVRQSVLPVLAAEGLDAGRLAATARGLGRARAAVEAAVADVLARAASMHPLGFARLDPDPIRLAPEEVGLRALASIVTAIGGAPYPPRLDRLGRLYGSFRDGEFGGGRTLGGCVVRPGRGGVLLCREPNAVQGPVPVRPGERLRWDGRFLVDVGADCPHGLLVGALGRAGWSTLVSHRPEVAKLGLPHPARLGLPAFFDGEGLLAVPILRYNGGKVGCSAVSFAPENPVTSLGHSLASARYSII